jgi:hypothetical protein
VNKQRERFFIPLENEDEAIVSMEENGWTLQERRMVKEGDDYLVELLFDRPDREVVGG